MAAGGQGAPLVPFADKIFFYDENIPRVILNLGGIANVTILSKACETFAFDAGPANMLIDGAMKKFFNLPFDKDGKIARSGKTNQELLNRLMQTQYLNIMPPKSTGRELFGENFLNEILKSTDDTKENIIATLTEFTVKSVRDAFNKFIYPKTKVKELIIGGGGAYNIYMKELFGREFEPTTIIKTHEDFGISNKYKEAMAFALLAYTSYYKIPNNIKTATGAVKDIVLGKIIMKG
jgi:anhydro-N-acetylmuramic acid kinase